jgi:nitrous oxidase accessory protein
MTSYYDFCKRGRAFRIVTEIITLEILLLAGGVSAAMLTVDASGGANYTRIQDAINNSNPRDTILVNSGVYYEKVDINKQLIVTSSPQ